MAIEPPEGTTSTPQARPLQLQHHKHIVDLTASSPAPTPQHGELHTDRDSPPSTPPTNNADRTPTSSSYDQSPLMTSISDAGPTTSSTPSRPLPLEVKDSDEEDDSDSDALPQFSTLFIPAVITSHVEGLRHLDRPHHAPNTSVRSLRSKKRLPNLSSPLSHRAKKNTAFDLLLAQSRQDVATESSSKRLKTALAEAQQRSERGRGGGDRMPEFAEDLLKDVAAEKEEGDKDKVMRALRRTEATNVTTTWSFFDGAPGVECREFPRAAVEGGEWAELGEEGSRDQMFSSGFVQMMISMGQALPGEVLTWLWDMVVVERRGILRTAYLGCLCASRTALHQFVTPEMIHKVFSQVGASEEAQNVRSIIEPVPQCRTSRDSGVGSLRHLLQLLAGVARYLKHDAQEAAIQLLLRLGADRIISDKTENLQAWQEALRALVKSMELTAWSASIHRSITTLHATVPSAVLQYQIVSTLPSTHPRIRALRQRLATVFLFDSLDHLTTDLPLPVQQYTDHVLTSPTFHTTSTTDYPAYSCRVLLLSISLGNGLAPSLVKAGTNPSAEYDLTSNPTTQSRSLFKPSTSSSSSSSSNPPLILPPVMATTHHASLDRLATALTEVSIPNPGAAYMTRIETREVLGLVAARVRDPLRLSRRGTVDIFGGVGGVAGHEAIEYVHGKGFVMGRKKGEAESSGQRAAMHAWLGRRGQRAGDAGDAGIAQDSKDTHGRTGAAGGLERDDDDNPARPGDEKQEDSENKTQGESGSESESQRDSDSDSAYETAGEAMHSPV